ncbi:hypothetical protein SD70_19790 [Gordoniibacillus kamchatkensis]|uniref:Secreted protein n=1 Tax=Gordoniibacillus kamchatkensis TaxID=1590651 RepID=A0ABR5AEN1_9BACL|nr:hypothetical protein SD70_19790 [Paenibacillus sp. VKM B-2647]
MAGALAAQQLLLEHFMQLRIGQFFALRLALLVQDGRFLRIFRYREQHLLDAGYVDALLDQVFNLKQAFHVVERIKPLVAGGAGRDDQTVLLVIANLTRGQIGQLHHDADREQCHIAANFVAHLHHSCSHYA